MKSLVVLPTYNERDNIREVVKRILALGDEIGMVIVDDNSPDGTGQIADELSRCYPGRVWVIHRQGKRGRGLAGVDGFKYALRQGADYIFEMDADLSHRPEEIPLFWEKIKKYDIVIGSRYLKKKGGPKREWIRNLISFLARCYLRLVLNLRVTDPTSGFRCFRRDVLASIDLKTLISKGPAIVSEVLYRCQRKGYSITEVPITFEKRKRGTSKLTAWILLSCLILPVRFRCHSLWQY